MHKQLPFNTYLKNLLLSLVFMNSVFARNNIITPEIIDESVIEQEAGQYGEMKRINNPLGTIQKKWDERNDKAGIYTVMYSHDQIIKLRLREYMKSIIILPTWEVAEHILVGDESVLKVHLLENQKIILESQGYVGVDTNLQVVGRSGNVYLFYIRIEGYNSNFIPDLKTYVLSRIMVKNITKSVRKKSDDYLEEINYKPSEISFNYQMYGSKKIAPKFVFNDGYRTWLFYGNEINKKEIPAVYAIIDTKEALINSTLINKSVVISYVGDLTLKLGKEQTCLRYTDA